jgi:hypothetical protein
MSERDGKNLLTAKLHGSESEKDYKWSLLANGHSQNDLELQKNFVINNGHGFSNTDTWRELSEFHHS